MIAKLVLLFSLGFVLTASAQINEKAEKFVGKPKVVEKSPFTDDFTPLLIVDNIKITDPKVAGLFLHLIDPNKIDSMHVFKDKEAIEKYGEEGKNGVIVIKTKNYNKEGKP